MKTIKIGNIEYSRTVLQNNIKKTYSVSLDNEHNNWYQEARDFGSDVAKLFDIPISKVLGVTSVLSPLKEWGNNKKLAVEFIASGDCGHMKNNKKKARDIMALDDDSALEFNILKIINGQKTTAFYLNMMYPNRTDYVTIDRHAVAIAIGRNATEFEQSLTKNQYKFLKDCYIMLAETLGLAPLHLQSITWQTWKRIK
jgi:hypothetical protein